MPTEKQRRAAERRRLRRQRMRRVQREARRRRFVLIASVAGVLVVIAVVVFVVVQTSGDHSNTPAANGATTPANGATTPAATTPSPAPTCTWTQSGTPAKPATLPPTQNPPTSGNVNMVLQTTRGLLTLQLNPAAAPCAVESFVSLAQQKFYNNTPCHRLTSNVLQCGDPTGTGRGGPGYTFPDELTGHEKYTRGVVAMANSGPNTNGSQFFIVYKDYLQLPPNYTIFGKVTSGMKIVDKVAARGSTPAGDGKPKLPITLVNVGQVQ